MKTWKDAFIDYFRSGIKPGPQSQGLQSPRPQSPGPQSPELFSPIVTPLGLEVEHFIVRADSKEAVPYSGENGVGRILEEFLALYPGAQRIEDEALLGFITDDFNITLEPASQIEISLAERCQVPTIESIYKDFSEKLKAILSKRQYELLTVGCQPVSPVDSLQLIPKERYRLMDEYFLSSGTGGRQMMRGSASTQVSIDYYSEEDFRRKIQAAHYFSPALKLLCDNAAQFEGKELKTHLKRTDIWRRVDPVRCAIPDNIFDPSYGFSDYADFIGEMPPIFIMEDGKPHPTGRKTVSELFQYREPTKAEIEHLLSMAFPEVRLKQFLEIRVADSIPLPKILAYCALIKGLFYSESNLSYAEEQIVNLTLDDILSSEDDLMEKGWRGSIYGESAASFASKLLDLAASALPNEETHYLDVFRE